MIQQNLEIFFSTCFCLKNILQNVKSALLQPSLQSDLTKCLASTRCLKITEKVSFSIASEASYVYSLNGQKLIKNAKNGPFWRVFENLKLAVKQSYQTCQFLIGQKLVEMAKMRHFEEYFQ